uniref:Macaca fascicularis brain cDNA, clone: QmoA-11982 n=1 Tax=Macaca fascicularis TaxID=9541 RepID=I7GPB0_MACFA|nr:unnamed protein product [Macaca fascicularis]
MLCQISCCECSSYSYCTVYMCAACVNPSKFCFRFWSFHLKYSWSCCELIFLVCSSVSDFQLPKCLTKCVFTNIPRQPCVSL